MSLCKLAWRNVWRSRRRSLATVSALTLSVLATVTYSGLVLGYMNNMERNVLDFELGAVQVFAKGYQERPSLHRRMEDSEAVLNRLMAAGLPAADRLLGAGLAASGEASAGARLFGLNVTRDEQVLDIGTQVMTGAWLDAGDPKGVVLGRKLASTLAIEVNDELVLLSQAADGSMANDLYRVRGILKTVGVVADRAGVFMTAAEFRSLMVVPQGAHQIIVARSRKLPLDLMTGKVEQAAMGHDVYSWRRLQPTLATMMDSVEGITSVMMLIVYIVVSIVVLNAMLMAVFERIREFGVLKALGYGPGRVLGIIFLECYMQAGLALLIGLVLCIPLLWYLATTGLEMAKLSGTAVAGMAFSGTWYAVVSPRTFAVPVVLLLVMVGLAVIYPAFKAARVKPVEAMRYR